MLHLGSPAAPPRFTGLSASIRRCLQRHQDWWIWYGPQKQSKRNLTKNVYYEISYLTMKIRFGLIYSKVDTNTKRNSSKAAKYGRVRSQLQDIEDSAEQFAGLNTELTKAVEESPSLSSHALGSTGELIEVEEARKEADKIGRLEVDVQRIQEMLLKLEDEKNKKGKSGLSRR